MRTKNNFDTNAGLKFDEEQHDERWWNYDNGVFAFYFLNIFHSHFCRI